MDRYRDLGALPHHPRLARARLAEDAADVNRQKHFSMIREFHLADFVTLANASAGTAAIFCCLAYLDGGHRDVNPGPKRK